MLYLYITCTNISINKKKIELKWIYKRNNEEFVRKFKLKFLAADDNEIKNFTRIYLILGDFIFRNKDSNELLIARIIFIGIYLRELYVDHEYGWFPENTKLGLHFLSLKTKQNKKNGQ